MNKCKSWFLSEKVYKTDKPQLIYQKKNCNQSKVSIKIHIVVKSSGKNNYFYKHKQFQGEKQTRGSQMVKKNLLTI